MAIAYSTIKDLLAYLRSTISDIESLEIDEDILTSNRERAAATKYLLQTAVEACANMAEHIIFGLDLGNPATSKELFPILVRHHIIDQKLAKKLEDAVGLRNILVHL